MNWKPNKWIAAALGLLLQPVGLLYVGRPLWAAGYLIALFALGIATIWSSASGTHILLVSGLSVVFAIVGAAHSYIVASKSSASAIRPVYSRWYGLTGIVVGAFAFVFLLRAFVMEPFRVPADAMAPSVPMGSFVLVSKWGYGHYSTYGIRLIQRPKTAPLARADLIVFDYPMRPELSYIKRVIGLPDDKVVYRDKRLTINGVLIRTSEIATSTASGGGSYTIFRHFSEELGTSPHTVMFNDRSPPIELVGVNNFPGREKCVYDVSGFACEVPSGNYLVMGDSRDNSLDSRYWGFVPESAIIGKVSHVFVPGT